MRLSVSKLLLFPLFCGILFIALLLDLPVIAFPFIQRGRLYALQGRNRLFTVPAYFTIAGRCISACAVGNSIAHTFTVCRGVLQKSLISCFLHEFFIAVLCISTNAASPLFTPFSEVGTIFFCRQFFDHISPTFFASHT